MPSLLLQALSIVWRAAPRQFLAAAALQILAGAAFAAEILVARDVLDRILDPSGVELSGVIAPLLILAAVTAFVSFASVARAEQQRLLSELVGQYATGQVIEVATAVDLLDFERPSFYDRLERARINAVVRPSQMATGILGLLSAGFAIAGLAAALITLEPLFFLLIVVAYAPSWLATRRTGQIMHRFAVEQTARDRLRSYVLRLLSEKDSAKEVKAFGLGAYLRRRHDNLYAAKITDLRTVVRRRMLIGLVGRLVTSVLTAGVIAGLVWFVGTGRMSLAVAGAAAGALVLVARQLQTLSASAGSLYESSLFLEDFTTFVADLPKLERADGGAEPGRLDVLKAEDVTFTYPSRHEPSLRGVSMRIRSGEVVALVGENGSGKTTLAKILAGLYAPDAGSVTWNGTDFRDVDPDALRAAIALIFQDFVKYHLSARENIGMGRHDRLADTNAIVEAAREAGIHDELERLPSGYDTRLGPEFFGGSELSVGQWQRLAIARAFFRDAPLIILDEPTAALDPRAELALFERVRSLARGRTVLLITHRFSTVRSADRIYVLEAGSIVEQGTHDALMAADGLYADLFRLQATPYVGPTA